MAILKTVYIQLVLETDSEAAALDVVNRTLGSTVHVRSMIESHDIAKRNNVRLLVTRVSGRNMEPG